MIVNPDRKIGQQVEGELNAGSSVDSKLDYRCIRSAWNVWIASDQTQSSDRQHVEHQRAEH